jgi:hypothetical protein
MYTVKEVSFSKILVIVFSYDSIFQKAKDGGRFVGIFAQLKTKAVSRETFSNCRAQSY